MKGKMNRILWIGIPVFLACAIGAVIWIGPIAILRAAYFSFSNDTEYPAGYNEAAFRKIGIGDLEADVIAALGKPFRTRPAEPYLSWVYSPLAQPDFAAEGETNGQSDYTVFRFENGGGLDSVHGQLFLGRSGNRYKVAFGNGRNSLSLTDAAVESLKKAGAGTAEIESRFGRPVATFEDRTVRWLIYSRSPSSGDYLLRRIGIDADGKVCRIVSKQYVD